VDFGFRIGNSTCASALRPIQLGKKKTFQRELNLIFDFFLQKKNQKSNLALSAPLFRAKHLPN
jgi:hypothetical protein